MLTTAAFLEKWLPGMRKDKLLAGIEWNGQLVGLEIKPSEVLEAVNKAMVPPTPPPGETS